MIKIIFFLITFSISSFASNIINQSLYEKGDRVDIMLSFDSPYDGKISQKKDGKDTILILKDAHINQKVDKDIISPFVQKMQIISSDNDTLIRLSSDENFALKASKTVDNFGLRLRITPKKSIPLLNEKLIVHENQTITTKKEDDIGSSFTKMIFTLFALIALLYLLKRWLESKRDGLNSSWLFGKDRDSSNQTQNSTIKVLQQKGLDHKNRVVLLSYEGKKYLILLGDSNIMLDRFSEDSDFEIPKFEQELTQNQEALNSYITQNQKLNSYKQKASI